MTENIALIKILFGVALVSGIIMRVVSVVNYLSVRNKDIDMTPSDVHGILSMNDKSVYRMNIVYKKRHTPFYAYSEPLNIQANELTLNCDEGDNDIYSACAVIQKYFIYQSAVIKRAHYNFSKIMSFFVGLFSVVSMFLASYGYNFSDEGIMINGMLIYIVTFLCGIVTSDFDVFACIESIRYIKKNGSIFTVNYYYARRILYGYVLHKLSRASAFMFFPVSMFVGMIM